MADIEWKPKSWRPIETLPPPGKRPGRLFVIVEGYQQHSGMNWRRAGVGIARTQNDGFYPEDIRKIEEESHMDVGSGAVTFWMPYDKGRIATEVLHLGVTRTDPTAVEAPMPTK